MPYPPIPYNGLPFPDFDEPYRPAFPDTALPPPPRARRHQPAPDYASLPDVRPQAVVEPASKPAFDLGNVGSALWEGATQQLVPGFKSALAQAYTGINPVEPGSVAERWMAEGRQAQAQSQARIAELQRAGQIDSSSEAIREAMPSLGYSGVSMLAAIPAGIAGTAATTPVGGALAAGAAAGAAGYRMAGSQLLNDSLAGMEAESQRTRGRGLTEDERNRAVAALTPVAQNTGLWEAGPEAVGNAAMFGLGRVALGLMPKEAMRNIAASTLGRAGVRAGAGAGAMGAEVATEGVTQFHQGNDQQRAQAASDALLAGKDPNAAMAAVKPQYEGAGGLWQATKDVAPATIATVLMMGAMAKPAHMAYSSIQQRREGAARVDDATQATADLRANLDFANETDIAEALAGFDRIEAGGTLPKKALERLNAARQQLTDELALRASPESLSEPLDNARGRAGYLGFADRAHELEDDQIFDLAQRPLPNDAPGEFHEARVAYGIEAKRRQDLNEAAAHFEQNPEAVAGVAKVIADIGAGKPLSKGAHGSVDYNLSSLSDSQLTRYRMAGEVLLRDRADALGKLREPVNKSLDLLHQEADRRANGQRRDPNAVREADIAQRVAKGAKNAVKMLDGLSPDAMERMAAGLESRADLEPGLADTARQIRERAQKERAKQAAPAQESAPAPGIDYTAERARLSELAQQADLQNRERAILEREARRRADLDAEIAARRQPQPALPPPPSLAVPAGDPVVSSARIPQPLGQLGRSRLGFGQDGAMVPSETRATEESAPALPAPPSVQAPDWTAPRRPAIPPATPLPIKQNAQQAQAKADSPVALPARPEGASGARPEGAREEAGLWTAFSPESGTLGIPRSEMPQIKAEHRGALVNFMKARGIGHRTAEMSPRDLKPTQAEFSPEKVDKALAYEGGERSILVSRDNRVLDGHHQWLAALRENKPIPVIRLNAPIKRLIREAHEFPSSTTSEASTVRGGQTGREAPPTTAAQPRPESQNAQRSQKGQAEAETAPLLDRGASPAGLIEQAKATGVKSGQDAAKQPTKAVVSPKETADKKPDIAPRKAMKAKADTPNPAQDSLLVAIAKLGGLDRDEARRQGVDPAEFKRMPIFGKPAFRKSGGKSFDAMAESLSEHGYPVADERGDYSPNALLDAIGRELSGSPVYTPAGHETAARRDAEMDQIERDSWLLDAVDFERSEFDSLNEQERVTAQLQAEASRDLGEDIADTIFDRVSKSHEDATPERFNEALKAAFDAARQRESEAGRQQAGEPGSRPAQDAESPLLQDYSLDDLRAEEARLARIESERKAAEAKAEAKAKADKERDSFSLPGSDRPADKAMAAGQMSMLDSMDGKKPAPSNPYATSEEREEAILRLEAAARNSEHKLIREQADLIGDAVKMGATEAEIMAAIASGDAKNLIRIANRQYEKTGGLLLGFGSAKLPQTSGREVQRHPSSDYKNWEKLTDAKVDAFAKAAGIKPGKSRQETFDRIDSRKTPSEWAEAWDRAFPEETKTDTAPHVPLDVLELAARETRQSRPSSATTKPATVAQARAQLVAALGERDVAALERSGRLVLHATDPSKTGAAGFVDGDGVVHLIPGNMDQTALDVALHEAMHLARDNRFAEGDRAKIRLAHAVLKLGGLKNFVGNPGFSDLVQQVYRMAAEGNEVAVEALNKAKLEAKADPRVDVAEESVAYLAQYADEKLPLVRRALALIRAALYRMGIKVRLTPADVRALALSALKARAKTANRIAAAREAMAHSRPTSETDAAEQARLWAEFQAVRAQFQAKEAMKTPFSRWFGAGTEGVTARDGKPLVLYHGTNSPEFNRWDASRAGQSSTHPTAWLGFFMTADKRSAARYGSRLLELHAKIDRPYYLTDADLWAIDSVEAATRMRRKLMAQGYDGAVVTAPLSAPYVIAFESRQVKHTTNENPTESEDFRYSKSFAAAPESTALPETVGRDEVIDFSSDDRFRHLFYSEPSPGNVKAFQNWLKSHPDARIRLYHGTAATNPILEKGLLKTTTSRRNSLQSGSGYVYLSVYPGHAKDFGNYAALNRGPDADGYRRALYSADLRIAELLPDLDQIKNQRMFAERAIGNSLAESLVFGHAARFKGNLPSNRIRLETRYSRPGRPPRMDSPRVAAKVLGDIGELRDALKSGEKAKAKIDPRNWAQMLSDLKADKRPQWLGLLTQDMLLQLAEKHLPAAEVRKFDDASEKMDAYENKTIQAEAFPLAERWQNLMAKDRQQADAMSRLIYMSTWFGVDPRQPAPKGKQVEWTRAKATFDGLTSAEARKLYGEVLAFYEGQTKRLFDELAARIERHALPEPDKLAAKDMLRQEFERMRQEGPYAPLMRFGDLTVWAEPRDKNDKPVFATFESVAEQRAFADWLKGEGYSPKIGVKMEEIAKRDLPQGDFVGKLAGIIDKTANGTEAQILKDAMYQLFLRSLPEQSIRKHFIHRKFVPGYSADALRTFAAFARRSAKQTARLAHADKMGDALDKMAAAVRSGAVDDPVAAGHLVNEMDKSYQWAMAPTTATWASRLTHLGFLWHLGASPAHLLLNLSQQAQVTFPWLAGELAGKKGFGAVASAMLKANRDFLASNPFVDPAKRGASAKAARERLENEYGGDMGRALKALEEAGKTDKTQTYVTAQLSEEDNLLWVRPWTRKITQGAAWFFHIAEVINRESSAIAAYRLGRESGMGHEAAHDLARRAINDTHFDYAPSNRARFMRGNVAKVLTLFKQYSLNITWQLGRNAYLAARGASPREKTVARTKLLGMLGMTFVMAGAVGLPFYGEAMWLLTQLLNAARDDDEPEWDADTEFRALLDRALSPAGEQAVRRGLVNAFLGIDLSSRIKFDDLWWRDADGDLQGKQAAYHALEQALGPVAGLAVRGFATANDAIDALLSGTSARGATWRALEGAMPKAIKDVSKGLRFQTEGATTFEGARVMEPGELGNAGSVGQLLGFTPASLAERYAENRAMMSLQRRIQRQRDALLDSYAMANRQNDEEVMAALREDMAAFNKRYPGKKITDATLNQSLKARERRREEIGRYGGVALDKRLAGMLLEGVR